MIIGNAPQLSTIRMAYGDATIMDFINLYMLDLVKFCGMQNKTTAMQIDAISNTIYSRFHFFKVTELMLFFCMAKAGELRDAKGNNLLRFYGSFSGDVVLTALNAFKSFRDGKIYEQIKNEDAENKQNWVSAKSELIAPLLAKMHKELDEASVRRLREEEERKQQIINEHNERFLKMLEARKELNA